MQRYATTFARVTSLLGAFVAVAVVLGLLGAGLLMPLVGATGSAARAGVNTFEQLPGNLEANPLAQQSEIVAADGSLLATPAEENRIIVPLEEIAPVMQEAQVAIEDSRFYDHGGADVEAVGRALASNAVNDSTQGGSTLTQQYVKLSLQEEARRNNDTEALRALAARSGIEGYIRKLRELKYAVALENRISKDEILEGYLNLAYYGDRTYGVEAAAQHYFGVSAADLNLPQAATLAGVVQLPSITDPVNNPEASVERRNVVLDRMYTLRMIEEEQWRDAKASELQLDVTDSQNSCANSEFPYFCDYVTAWLLEQPALGETRDERLDTLTRGGLTVETTLRPGMAKMLRQQVTNRVPVGDPSGLGAAGVMIEPGTGHVLAMGQNTQYSLESGPGQTTINYAVDQPYGGSDGFSYGSTAKAFALVTALEAGIPIESTLDVRDTEVPDDSDSDSNADSDPSDRPVAVFDHTDFSDDCGLAEGQEYPVANAEDGHPGGPIELWEATALSINTAFAELVSQLGTCEVRDTMMRLGMHPANYQAGEEPPEITSQPAAVTLGTDGVSPVTLASSYATLASGGTYCAPVPVTSITDTDGNELPIETRGCEEVVDPDVAAGVTELMTNVLERGGAWESDLSNDDRAAAGKTGTSDRSHQTWFSGFTPQYSTAVWVGNPDGAPEQDMEDVEINGEVVDGWLYGSKVAAPIWNDIMEQAHEGRDVRQFEEPSTEITEGEETEVPEVRGMTIDEAKSALTEEGFTVEIGDEVASSRDEGMISTTTPSGGTEENTGTVVSIYPSSGTWSSD